MVVSNSFEDFFVETTVNVTYQILVDDLPPDISGDSVRLILKANQDDPDNESPLNVLADVATSGALGKAIFVLTPTITDIPVQRYSFEVIWTTSAGEIHIIDNGLVSAKIRIQDV